MEELLRLVEAGELSKVQKLLNGSPSEGTRRGLQLSVLLLQKPTNPKG